MEADKSAVQQSANLLASRGQFDKAIAEWKKLLVDSPADGAIHNNIGDLHLKRNVPADAIDAYFKAGAAFQAAGSALKAIAVFKKILKIDPTRYKVYQSLGDLNAERGLVNNAVSDYLTLSKLYLKERMIREALAVYRTIANLDPANLDVKRRLAELCLQENLREEAVKTYLQLGKECTAQQRPKEARAAYEAVLQIDPGNTRAERLLINPQEAFPEDQPSRHADEAAGLGDLDRQQGLDKAQRQLSAGEYGEADALLSELLSAHPGDPEVCRLLAMLHLKRGELAVALSEIQFLAEAAIRAQDYALAESMVREYLKADPKCVTLLELLGNMCEQNGDGVAAVAHFGQAIDVLLEQPDPEMPNRAAELYARLTALAPASPLVAQFARAFSPVQAVPSVPVKPESAAEPVSVQAPVDPGPPAATPEPIEAAQAMPPTSQPKTSTEQQYKVHYELGVAYQEMGLVDEAIEELRVAVSGTECFADASSMLAGCLTEKGLLEPALECLEQAVADYRCEGDKSTSIRYELGLLYESAGMVDKAAAMFSAIPGFLDVPMRLARIRGGERPSAAESFTDPIAPAGEGAAVSAGKGSAAAQKKRRISYL